MKLYILILAAMLPVIMMANAIQLTSESPDELLLEFNLPEYKLVEHTENGIDWKRIECEEGSLWGEEGHPQLMAFSTAIAIPPSGDIIVNVLDGENRIIRDVQIAPAKRMVLDGDEQSYEFYQDNRIYSSNTVYPVQIASKGEAAFIGDRRFIPLMIYPFQYKASSRELTVHQNFRIRITIVGDKSQSKDWQLSENPIDLVGDSFFINNNSSKAWRLPKNIDNQQVNPKNLTTDINEIQFIVDREGIYKITYNYLKSFLVMMADSLDISYAWNIDGVDPRYLELTNEEGQVPIAFYGEADGRFDNGDYFEFYGDRHYGDYGYQDDYTAENVYTLSLKPSLGARMMVENGGLVNSNPLQYIVPDAYEFTVHLEEQLVSDKLGHNWSAADPDYFREDVWFWKKISAPNLDIIPFQLQYPKDTTIRTASAKVMLHGLTYSDNLGVGQFDHEASVRLNQAMINTHNWVGQTEKLFTNQNPIPNTFFNHGTNYLYIALTGNTPMGDREQVMLDWAEVKYWREYKTSEDFIKFTKPSNRPGGLYQFSLQGFSDSNVSLYKVGSSVFNNMQIEPFNLDGIAPWSVTFQDSVFSNSVYYFAVTESQKRTPKNIRLNFPSDLRNPHNFGDVVLVTPRSFISSNGTQTLIYVWEDEGYTVSTVDVQDIYDEFNHGIVSAEAIKEFVTYAYNNWASPQVKHLMLMGEGIEDTRDNSPSRNYNMIPIKKLWTYKHGATASDNWYGCVVGTDILADISVGRLNVWQESQILDYATKAVQYHTMPQTDKLWASHITLTAGGKASDGIDIFSQQSERIRRRNIPAMYRVSRVYTTTQTVSTDYLGNTTHLMDAINTGTCYLQFMGHGGGRIWADYNLFNFNNVATLNNVTYPIVTSLACYASAFDTNGSASISEALVLQPNKGAIATIGFSGLGYLDQDEDYGLALTEALFQHDFPSVGEAMIFTKARFYTTTSSTAPRYALTNGTAYLGDPMIKLRRPIPDIPITINNPSLAAGDTLRVSATFPSDVMAAQIFITKESGKIMNIPFDLPVVNGNFNASYVLPLNQGSNYLRRINITGYSPTEEYVGLSSFGVGRSSIHHQALSPSQPTWQDSVAFIGRIFTTENVVSLVCKVRTDSTGSGGVWTTLPMQQYGSNEMQYITTGKVPGQRTGKEIYYKYVLTTNTRSYETSLMNYVVAGPDLLLKDIALEPTENELRLKVLVQNIGNAASITTDLKLYYVPVGGQSTLYSTQDLAPLGVNAERWEYIDISNVPSGNLTFEVRVNGSATFSEWHLFYNTNNLITMAVPFNYSIVNPNGGMISSVDLNVGCEIPPNLVTAQDGSIFYINGLAPLAPNLQPDIYPIRLRSVSPGTTESYSIPYEIKTLDSSLVDSLGVFRDGKKIKLNFFYHPTDSLNTIYEGQGSFSIYRYDPTYRKWMKQGGNVSTSNNLVVFEVNRQGIYTIYRNQDRTGPSIDVNVQDQEFTLGGYVSGTGIISLLLNDTNGINVIDSTIKLLLNGVEVTPEEYAISINADNINRIPIKYQLNLSRGNYTLLVDCSDVNANSNSRSIQFFVNDEFDIVNIANYPNPVVGQAQDPKNDGRTRFTYVLTDDADAVTIKVYTISGRLVKTFSGLPTGVGYHEFPRTVYGWDCKDEQGYTLANGTYFYKFIAKKGSKTIEKTMKMAIVK